MKLIGNPTVKIYASGKNGRECGTRLNNCRFQRENYKNYPKKISEEKCMLFNTPLKIKSDTYGHLRCKECQENNCKCECIFEGKENEQKE